MALLVVGTPALSSPQHAAAAPLPDVVADADWILGSTFPDGAIAIYRDRLAVVPYFSHFAAIGLVHAYKATGDVRYADGAWRWLAWYQAHMDANGYVTDYNVVNGTLTSTGDMDSTDAYAGMFLLTAYNAQRASSDTSKTIALRSGITKAVAAIESTMQEDGLTWAKPSWHVKYLMDQAEAYAGLRSAAWLARSVLNDPGLAVRADGDADRMRAGVAGLWNEVTGAYDWAKFDNGARQTTNWANLYSDAMQQIWAVAFGLVDHDPNRAKLLLQRFGATHPSWDQPAAIDQFQGVPHAVDYWPVAAWAFDRLGDPLRASQATSNIRTAAIGSGRAWPFTTAADGQLLYLEAKSFDLLPPRPGTEPTPLPPASDTQPPTAPKVSATVKTLRRAPKSVDVTWTQSTDNVGVSAYRLYRNGSLVTTTAAQGFRDVAISRRRTYSYSVVALDAAGNASPSSNAVTVRA